VKKRRFGKWLQHNRYCVRQASPETRFLFTEGAEESFLAEFTSHLRGKSFPRGSQKAAQTPECPKQVATMSGLLGQALCSHHGTAEPADKNWSATGSISAQATAAQNHGDSAPAEFSKGFHFTAKTIPRCRPHFQDEISCSSPTTPPQQAVAEKGGAVVGTINSKKEGIVRDIGPDRPQKWKRGATMAQLEISDSWPSISLPKDCEVYGRAQMGPPADVRGALRERESEGHG